MSKNLIAAALSFIVLTGCSATPFAIVPPVRPGMPTGASTAAPALPPHAQAIGASTLRHVMDAENGQASLWGLRYSGTNDILSQVGYDWTTSYMPQLPANCGCYYELDLSHGRDERGSAPIYLFLGTRLDWSHTGAGEFKPLGQIDQSQGDIQRIAYTVPDDKMLVINEVQGYLWINGFEVTSGTRQPVHYLFGGGETVLFKIGKNSWADGYDADPSLFGADNQASAAK